MEAGRVVRMLAWKRSRDPSASAINISGASGERNLSTIDFAPHLITYIISNFER